MIITLLAAHDRNLVIGRDNDLPWSLPLDMRHFRLSTTGHPIIMGRKTYESIGRALPLRKNIVLTKNRTFAADKVAVCHSIESANELAKATGSHEVFVIGGAEIYKIYLPIADKLSMTFVDGEVEGDTYFPEVDYSNWRETDRLSFSADANHAYPFDIVTFERINPNSIDH